MRQEESGEEGESSFGEPERWKPPAQCPECSGTETRFITLRYEMSVYECLTCRLQFEVDEGE